MFGDKARRIADLEARVAALTAQRDTEITGRALDAAAMRHRLDRALRAAARARQDAAQQSRVADRLSDQLMGSLGYTPVALSRLGVPLADESEVSS